MKGDFSRKTFDASNHYSGVLMQQGRVQLDADWNEQLAIQRHRDYTEAEDVLGECGAPKYSAGFRVQPAPDGADLIIFPGHFYVHGRLCELESTPVAATFVSATEVTVSLWHVDGAGFANGQYVELSATNVASEVVRIQTADKSTLRLTFASNIAVFQAALDLHVRRLTTYLTQPDLPDPPYASQAQPPSLDLPDGSYVVYIDVHPRHMTFRDASSMRESALNGPDHATRVKTVWQVKLWPGPDDGMPLPADIECDSAVPAWNEMTASPTGRMSARTEPGQEPGPCVMPPGAVYTGGNQLYRLEVHQGGLLGTDPVTIKWSRDNGSVVKSIVPIANSTGYTIDTGPDDVLNIANGQWVEQIDDAIDLNGIARHLFQFQMNPLTAAVTLDFPVSEDRHPQLRRWDSEGEVLIPWPPVGAGYIQVENNIQVRFEAGTYHTGDNWLVTARELGIEWPKDATGEPLSLPRRGIVHHYCRIGVLHADESTLEVDDCRPIFPPLNELKSTSSCCTFTVGDGVEHVGDFTLIQEAVNNLPPEGGQICIFPGTYVENVEIVERTNVHIKGCGDRTRVVSRPPDAEGVAAAVFNIAGCVGVKLESLAVEAAEAGPGILADGETPNNLITIEKISLKAAKDSAIKVRNSEGVIIERCRIEMTDGNGGWAGIFIQAEYAFVHENVVEGALVHMTHAEIFGMKGALAVSGLQLGGGCEHVRVHDNLFRGCSGQGITLGSIVEVGEDGQPTDPGGRGRWPSEKDDRCDPCDDPTTGDRPHIEGEPPTRPQSEGDLSDIDIRRNRILDTGLDGIGVAHFFDLQQAVKELGLVRVEDLAIADNRIERCVRRRFAPIPPNMLELMAYGGISLSLVEHLEVHDNRIEDVGDGGVLPVCGIFLLYGEGVEIGRNHILNRGRAAPVAGMVGRRGGIHVAYALGPSPTSTSAGLSITHLAPAVASRGAPAAVVEENTVDVVRGQALSVGAMGPVSVVSNRLISRGLVAMNQPVLTPSSVAHNVLGHLSSLVAIVNLGSASVGGAWNMGAGAQATEITSSTTSFVRIPAKVLFNDNQCLLDVMHDTFATGLNSTGKMLLPSILVVSLDDVGFSDNQCECQIAHEQLMPAATLISGLISQRTVSNRFSETLGRAWFSGLTFAIMNMTTNNQANHCLKVVGVLLQTAQPNHVLISTSKKTFCDDAEKKLAGLLAPVLHLDVEPGVEAVHDFKETISAATEKTDSLRAAGLRGLELIEHAHQSRLQKERDRISHKLGAGHPRVSLLTGQIESIAALRTDLNVEVARAETVVPRVGQKEWALHGYVWREDMSPAPGLTVSLVDSKGQWLQALGFAYTDARGYFLLVIPAGDTECSSEERGGTTAFTLEAWIRITDRSRVELHRDAEPVTVSAARTEYREIVLAKKPGGMPPVEEVGPAPGPIPPKVGRTARAPRRRTPRPE